MILVLGERGHADHTDVAHLTWHASDVARTREFLERRLDWTFVEVDNDYFVFQPSSGTRVGLTSGPHRGESAFLPQIAVDDLENVLSRARDLDSASIDGNGVIEHVGISADIRDPDGSLFSLVEFRSE